MALIMRNVRLQHKQTERPATKALDQYINQRRRNKDKVKTAATTSTTSAFDDGYSQSEGSGDLAFPIISWASDDDEDETEMFICLKEATAAALHHSESKLGSGLHRSKSIGKNLSNMCSVATTHIFPYAQDSVIALVVSALKPMQRVKRVHARSSLLKRKFSS